MSIEIWIPTEPDTIHRIDPRTGTAAKPPLTVPNSGILAMRHGSDERILVYSGEGSRTVVELNADGEVTSTYQRSGADIVVIEKDAITKDASRNQCVVVGPSGTEERWTYRPSSGTTVRENARNGKHFGEINLPAGGMILMVRTRSSTA